MSDKNFMSYGDAETVFTGFANAIKKVNGRLTNVTDAIGWNNHKNLLPLTLSSIKKISGGVWSGNSVLINGITYTINENDDGSISSITATGTASDNSRLNLLYNVDNIYGGMILSCLSQSGSPDTFRACLQQVSSPYTELANDTGNGSYISNNTSKKIQLWIVIKSGYEIPSGGLTFYPMIRNASENSDYEPYHPVLGPAVNDHEERIEDLESGLTKQAVTLTADSGITVVLNNSYIENKRLYINAQVQLDNAYTGNNTRLTLATLQGIKVTATQAINIVGVSNLGTYCDSILCGTAVKDSNDSKFIVDNIIGASSAIYMFISGVVNIE